MPTTDFADIKVCTHANLRKAMRTVSQAYDDALKPSGLRATQFTLLSVLAKQGSMPLTKLAEILVVDRTTLTRNLRPLERDGLVVSKVTPDQRIRELTITTKGKKVLSKALPLWRAVQKRFVSALGHEEWTAMLGSLAATVDAAQDG